jgi:hypothetical protein
MKELTDLQQGALSAIIERRVENPITGKEIANGIGLKPRSSGKEGADMRSIINALRVKGYPICASGSGYWWPGSREEFQKYLESLEERIESMQRAYEGMKDGYDKIDAGESIHSVSDHTMYTYRVPNGIGQPKTFQVRGNRIAEFLVRYPDAKLLE